MSITEIAIESVRRATGTSRRRMLSASREWPAVEARQMAALLLYGEGQTDYAIACALGRSRSAVTLMRKNGRGLLEVSKAYRAKYEKAKKIYDEQKSLRKAES